MARLEPLGARRLLPQVVETLRTWILERPKEAGHTLPSQGDLTRQLGVSRTVLREAMKILEAQGLIFITQGRRPEVRPAGAHAVIDTLGAHLQRTDGSLLHLVEVRRPLEGEIAALAAARITNSQLDQADIAVADLHAAKTLDQQVAADLRFHRLLAEATGNPVFVVLLDTLAGLLTASREHTIGTFGAHAAIEGHRDILRALRKRDPKGARDAMLRHLGWNERQIREGKP